MDTGSFRDFAHHLLGALQADAIYPHKHPRVSHALRELYLKTTSLLQQGSIRVALTGTEFIVADEPLPVEGDLLQAMATVMKRHQIGRLIVNPGLRRRETSAFVSALNAPRERIREEGGIQEALVARRVHSVLAGPLTVGDQAQQISNSLSESWDRYTAGLATTRRLRDHVEQGIDASALQEVVRLAADMADAVQDHGNAFLLLQALKKHDDYSYTHSLNVALLSVTMAQRMELPARLLTDVTIAALLHDIGKELVPDEVLNKPGKLTPEEWETMQRHSADGAKLLMDTPGSPDLAVIVAYEHQLAYEPDNPDHGRWPLHLISQLVCVADVYDALRSNRPYRGAIPPERAMQIMEREAPEKFDPVIFSGFRRMLGYYPPGTVLELTDGSRAVSLAANPDHVDRPRVLVVMDEEGRPVEPPLPLDLVDEDSPAAVASLDPDEAGVDPFDYI